MERKIIKLLLGAIFSFGVLMGQPSAKKMAILEGDSFTIPWGNIQKNFKNLGGNLKALDHVKCFYEQHKDREFSQKPHEGDYWGGRCYSLKKFRLSNHPYMTIIDYVKPSSKRRMYLVNLKTGNVEPMGVAHGRYQSGFFRFLLRENKNSIKWARYFSNEVGSNAPSSGFFVAGQEYDGKFGRSLMLHGLEEGVNDNACKRAVVIHKHWLVSKNRAYIMSSGCPMVSKSYINTVVDTMKGEQSGMALDKAGGLVFVYGPREHHWQTGTCPIN